MASKGSINKRVISGKTYYYHQYLENGKQRSRTLSEEEAYAHAFSIYFGGSDLPSFQSHPFNAEVLFGAALFSLTRPVESYRKRFCFPKIENYLRGQGQTQGKVLVLYGLRRTGKTTLMLQSIRDLSFQDFARAAYIKCDYGKTIYDLLDDLKFLTANGFRFIFIDEVTLLEDFIQLSSTLSDIYGMMARIVLSGTDSLGFLLASRNELYDRCLFLHTTYIPFSEFAETLGICSIDRYIEYGGTMSFEGIDYNKAIAKGGVEINEYVYSSIVHNIIHSMRMCPDNSYYLNLYDLYEKGELENVINRVVEDSNHRFAIATIERVFKSRDYGSLKQLLSSPRNYPQFGSVLEKVDEAKLREDLMAALNIIDKEKQTHKIDDTVLSEAELYLRFLDVIAYVDEIAAPSFTTKKRIVFTQPGLRYSQAKQLIEILLKDESLQRYDRSLLEAVKEKLLSDVKGRMIEDIVLLESSMKNPKSFKMFFPLEGEYDMAVLDDENHTSSIYEIKYATVSNVHQTRFLKDEHLQSAFESVFYPINSRIVLYRGESSEIDGVFYQNIEEYLLSQKQEK